MKTYVNTSLIDAHNAQMQLEQMENIRFKRAGTMEVYGKFLLICSASLALLMFGWGVMMWFMSPAPAPVTDEHIYNYEISEVFVQGTNSKGMNAKARDKNSRSIDFPEVKAVGNSASGASSLSESLAEIQDNLTDTDTEIDNEVFAENTEQSLNKSQTSTSEENIGIDTIETSKESFNPPEGDTNKDAQSVPSDKFVVFRTHDLPGDAGRIWTGLQYQSEDLSKPVLQYCYLNEASTNNESTKHDLGRKTAESGLVWVDSQIAQQYKEFCQFLNT